ncbi:DUF3558 domain-containing protein [Saccharopolyspora taberi]|uniref:DUF3558 domain-containing protein n=1 Tax=Saccharopolyspora taberi TaxID=60895 RepID=A0ABN3V5S4_9PSEU
MTEARHWLLGLAAVGLLATGCTTSPTPTPESPATSEKPSRPADLAVAGKPDTELCELLTAEQQSQLGVGRPTPDSEVNETTGVGFPGCGWLTPPGEDPPYDITVYAVPESTKDFMDRLSPAFPETEASYTVAGFPAKQAQRGESLEQLGCMVGVDVADGQTLGVFVGPGLMQVMSNKDICDKAKQAAEAAVATLRSQG